MTLTGYIGVTVIDDGDNGTEGDGDGIAEAGETVGLRISLRNTGRTMLTGIHLTASCDEDWAEVDDETTYDQLNLPSSGSRYAQASLM